MEAAAKEFGLEVNCQKTKYMVVTKKRRIFRYLWVGEYTFDGVRNFKYLGAVLTSKNDVTEDIAERMAAGNTRSCLWALQTVFRNKNVSRAAKIRLRPVVTYGSETWVSTKADEQRLCRLERKILRSTFGPARTVEGFRIRMYQEVTELIWGV
ncbi:uncharacterized protein [Rhodnius prolixus]|uniref:uncharacterized protein n=1 Tax=Rhodnius prolixus TaxID=13249 RepID=UPI003D18A74D